MYILDTAPWREQPTVKVLRQAIQEKGRIVEDSAFQVGGVNFIIVWLEHSSGGNHFYISGVQNAFEYN